MRVPIGEVLHLRITKGDVEEIDELVERHPDFKRAMLIRQALRAGLAEIRRDPGRLVQSEPKKAKA